MKSFLKKAKSCLKKLRREVKKAFKKKAGGNWYNPRKQSESARSFIRNQPVVYFAAPVMHCVSRFTRGVVEYYTTYRDEWETPATSLALALIKDVYNLDVLPLLTCGRLMRDQESMDLISDELFELLCEYGGMNIVFHDKKTRVPRKVTRDIVINHELFLTKKRCGIPVRIFFLLLAGGMEVPYEVLAEISGIPMRKHRWTYKELVRIFQNAAKRDHRKQLLRNKVPSKHAKLKDPNIIYV